MAALLRGREVRPRLWLLFEIVTDYGRGLQDRAPSPLR